MSDKVQHSSEKFLSNIQFDYTLVPAALLTVLIIRQKILETDPECSFPLATILGSSGTLIYFISILVHEYGHFITASRFGSRQENRVILPFGGVKRNALHFNYRIPHLSYALSGPFFSIVFALSWLLVYSTASLYHIPGNLLILCETAFVFNSYIALINLIPVYPFDGFILLHYALTEWSLPQKKSVQIIFLSGVSAIFFSLITGGLLICSGFFIQGSWCIFASFLIKHALSIANEKRRIQNEFYGEKVSYYMRENPITVPSSITFEEFMNTYFYRFHKKIYPVIRYSSVIGMITNATVKRVPHSLWDSCTTAEIAEPCTRKNTITPETDVVDALEIILNTSAAGLLVIEDECLVGVLTIGDLCPFFASKLVPVPRKKNPAPVKNQNRKNHEQQPADKDQISSETVTPNPA